MKIKHSNPFATALAISLAASPLAFAADRIWDGGGADNNWNTAANWDAAIATGDSLFFDGSTRLTPNNNSTANNDYNLIFNSGAGAFTLSGNAIDLLSGGNVTNHSANAQNVNVPIQFLGSGTFTSHGGTLTIGGAITESGPGARTLTVTGAGNVTISGALTANNGDLNLTKTGTGTLTLSGDNSGYSTNTVTVNAGTLVLDYSSQNNTKLDGSGLVLGGGNLVLTGGSHTENTGDVSLTAGASSVSRSTGSSILQMNTISRNVGATLDVATTGIATTDNGLNDGILGGYMTLGGTTWATSGGSNESLITGLAAYETSTTQANWAATENISLSANPTAAVTTRTINSLRLTDAVAVTITAANTLTLDTGGLLATGSGAKSISGGTLRISATATDLIVHQHSSAAMTISSVIADGTGSDGLTKSGSGTLILEGGNTYSGQTFINQGTIFANNTTGSATGTGAVTVATDGKLGGTGTIAPTGTNGINVTGVLAPGGSVGTAALTFNLASTSGTITMAANAEFEYELGVPGATMGTFGTSDYLAIAGAASNDFNFNGNNIDFLNTGAVGYYRLFDTNSNNASTWSGLTFDGTTGIISAGLTYSNLASGLTGSLLVGTASNGGTTGDIYLHVIPEPGAALLGSLGMLALLRRRRG
jgi:autotransporter-associated beta strand protein